MWDQTRYALDFFQKHLPFWEMWPANDLADGRGAYVLAKEGEIYAVYMPEAHRTQMTLAAGEYRLRWYNPRKGGALKTGDRATVKVGEIRMGQDSSVRLSPPSEPSKDWVALLEKLPAGQ